MFELPLIMAVVMALVEGIKKVGIPSRFSPLVAIVLGIVAGIFFVNGTVPEQVFYGVAIGLASAGLFDLTKVIRKN